MLQIRTKYSVLSVILACALASGCVTRPVYDDSWAEQVKVARGTCPTIDGTYQNAGEEFHRARGDTLKRTTRSLTRLLNVGYDHLEPADETRLGPAFDDPSMNWYQSVRLQLMDGKLHMEVSRADGGIEGFDLPIRQQCQDSTLLVETNWDGTGTLKLLGSFVEHNTLSLGRAQDGSLLVRKSEVGAMLFLWWPVMAGGEVDWIRFAPATAAPEQLTTFAP